MKNILLGLLIISDSVDLKNPSVAALTLLGTHDDVLLQAFFWSAHGKAAVGDEYKTDSLANYGLNNLKEMIRDTVRHVFEMSAAEEELSQAADLQDVRRKLSNTNRPHELGTVAEIAKALGISKSEVRRRKADGTLEELLSKN